MAVGERQSKREEVGVMSKSWGAVGPCNYSSNRAGVIFEGYHFPLDLT